MSRNIAHIQGIAKRRARRTLVERTSRNPSPHRGCSGTALEEQMPLGAPELIIILVIVIVVFGAGKLAGVGSGLGRSIREFRSEVKDKPDEASKA